jgi:hypothetical protein
MKYLELARRLFQSNGYDVDLLNSAAPEAGVFKHRPARDVKKVLTSFGLHLEQWRLGSTTGKNQLRFRDSGPIHGRRRDRYRSSSQDDAH